LLVQGDGSREIEIEDRRDAELVQFAIGGAKAVHARELFGLAEVLLEPAGGASDLGIESVTARTTARCMGAGEPAQARIGWFASVAKTPRSGLLLLGRRGTPKLPAKDEAKVAPNRSAMHSDAVMALPVAAIDPVAGTALA
jgi:hypothetical protein